MHSLKYFNTIKVPQGDLENIFSQLEKILQQEHGVDGRHQVATQSQDGFMSAADKLKLDNLQTSLTETIQTLTKTILQSVVILSGRIDNAQAAGSTVTFSQAFAAIQDTDGDYVVSYRTYDTTASNQVPLGTRLVRTPSSMTFYPEVDGVTIEWSLFGR